MACCGISSKKKIGRLKQLNQYLDDYIPRQRTILRVKQLAQLTGLAGKPAGDMKRVARRSGDPRQLGQLGGGPLVFQRLCHDPRIHCRPGWFSPPHCRLARQAHHVPEHEDARPFSKSTSSGTICKINCRTSSLPRPAGTSSRHTQGPGFSKASWPGKNKAIGRPRMIFAMPASGDQSSPKALALLSPWRLVSRAPLAPPPVARPTVRQRPALARSSPTWWLIESKLSWIWQRPPRIRVRPFTAPAEHPVITWPAP